MVSLDELKELIDKWAPRFGFASYRYKVGVLPKQAADCWGKSVWLHDDDFFEIRVHPNRLQSRQLEALVIHELAHGLVSLAANGREEAVCNRLAKLLLGEDVQTPNIWALGRCTKARWAGTGFIDLDAVSDSTVDPFVLAALPLIVDDLPPREQQLVNAVYWEGVSLMEVARRLGISRRTAGRLHKSAMTRMRVLVEELQGAIEDNTPGVASSHSAPGVGA